MTFKIVQKRLKLALKGIRMPVMYSLESLQKPPKSLEYIKIKD